MARRNKLTNAPPSDVIHATYELGVNLKVARLRRGLTINEIADRIGTGARAVADAERGKLTTSISVYVALLSEFKLLGHFLEVASPQRDEEGQRHLNMRMSSRAKKIDENASRFKSDRDDNYFLSYWERWDKLDEGY
jgi:Helix-turn-helix.